MNVLFVLILLLVPLNSFGEKNNLGKKQEVVNKFKKLNIMVVIANIG